MVQAYILVQTEVGKSAAVAGEIAGIGGVVSAEDVTGPYDVIVRVEAPTVDDLGQLITRIQEVPHITRTTTCTVIRL
ncbi:MAG TPA: Lrp/AsnC ligand binding domain-containing protein [Ornithinicoccus sp.]|nr:Lrp/AsnC ligand binding domain-containing protein [Ornithinicoccus sp.]